MEKKSEESQFPFISKLPRNSKWILEFTQGPHSAHLFQIKKIIAHQKTPFQTIDVVELFHYGKTLFLDERLQATEVDEFLYHESITHPALVTHPNPKKVLIIGGADGGAAHQVLKHQTVKKLFIVDIDGELIKICQKFLPEINKQVFKNPKLKILVEDGREFLSKTKEKFDVIINDLTAPLSNPPSYLLFTKEFYKIVCNRLERDGIFALQADSTNHLNNKIFTSTYKTVERVFPIVRALRVFIPSYNNSWGFIIASKKNDPILLKPPEIRRRIKNRGLKDLKFYDDKIHQSLFILPKNLRAAIKKQKTIIRDNHPIITLE